MKALVVLMVMVCGAAFAAAGIPVEPVRKSMEQGGFLVVKVPVGAAVWFEERPVAVGEDGLAVIGFDRKQKPENVLKVCAGERCVVRKVKVAAREYKVQKVTKVPKNTVEPSKEEQKEIAADNVEIGRAKEDSTVAAADRYTDFSKAFDLPVKAPVSGVYGSSRSYNGKEFGSWHKGFDLAAPVGTPVKAPAAGVVRLVRNTFLTGNLVMVDHGAGILSLYAHMQEADVKVGQKVARGDMLGKVGTTGRSSGPHLHWGMYWQDVAIDPILWVEEQRSKQTERAE